MPFMTNDSNIYRFANVFDLLYDGVIIIDDKSRIVFANAACHRIFGHDSAALIGQPLDILIPAEQRTQHHHHVNTYKKDPKSRLMSDRSILFAVNKLGEEIPVTISITSFTDKAAHYYIAVIRDGALLNRQFENEKIRAETDALTQLGNRRYLSRIFAELVEKPNQQFAVLFIDLDKFKPVNDEFGHEIGDKTLQIISKRLNAVLRSYDVVVRIGGDEFAVLLNNVYDQHSVKPIIRKIIHSISRPIHAQQFTFTVGASIGCAFYPQDGQTEKELLKKSDNAMYHAKSRGTGFSFYQDEKQLDQSNRITRITKND